jgi:hypothetical protein
MTGLAIQVEALPCEVIDLHPSQCEEVPLTTIEEELPEVVPPEPRSQPRYETWMGRQMVWELHPNFGPRWFYQGADFSLSEHVCYSGYRQPSGYEACVLTRLEFQISGEGHGRTRWHARQAAQKDLRAKLNALNVLAHRLKI